MKSKNISGKILSLIGFICIAIVNLVPFIWGLLTSLKPTREVAIYPPKIFGSQIVTEHYATVLKGSFSTALINSIIYSIAAIIIGVLCAMLIAYAITRFRFRGKKLMFMLILFGIPLSMGSAAMVVPNYMMFSALKMTNKFYTLPLIYTAYNLPMAIWILIGGMQSIPYAIEEAAMIDGCNPLEIFFQVVLPVLKPTCISVAILQTMWIWNDYLLPYLVLDITKYKTIPIAIQYLKGGYGAIDMGAMMGMLVLAIIPIVIFYMFCQRYIIEGVVAGAVKG